MGRGVVMGGRLLTIPIYKKTAFSLCSGTAIHLTNPNDLGAVQWTPVNVTNVCTNCQTDPFSVINNAGDIKCNNAGGGGFSVNIYQAVGSLTANTTYEISGYLKPIAGPVWVIAVISDPNNSSDQFGFYFNCATAASGTLIGNGSGAIGGTLDCHNLAAAGNSYVQFTFSGHYTSNSSVNTRFALFLVDGDGTGAPTLNQEFYYYTIGP
jgi:hypothetical protein